MNKLFGHKATLHIAKKAGPRPMPATGKPSPTPIEKGTLSPLLPRYAGDPPLRAAQGDDALMSEEPSVNERG